MPKPAPSSPLPPAAAGPSPAERLLALAAPPDAPLERLAALLDAEPRLARAVLHAAGALGSADERPGSLAAARLSLGAEGLRDVVLAVALSALGRARPAGADAALAAAFARAIAPLVGADPAAAVEACVLPAAGAPRAVELLCDFARELAAWARGASAAPPRNSPAAAALGLTPIDVERLLLLRSRALQLARCSAA